MEYITHAQVKDVINTDEPFAVEDPCPVGCTLVYMEDNTTLAIIDGDGRPIFRASTIEIMLYCRHWGIMFYKIEYRISDKVKEERARTMRDMLMKLR